MRGELGGVWGEMWRHVWVKLARHKQAPDDLFCELFREFNALRVAPLAPATDLAAIVDDPGTARAAFRRTKAADLAGERALADFLERAHRVIDDFDSADLTDRYFKLTENFLDKFNLRYELRREFRLFPTLAGVFSRLVLDLRQVTSVDPALSDHMHAFEEAIRDLKTDQSAHRIKKCIHAQMNLLEAIAQRDLGATGNSLGKMCKDIKTWPHETVREAVSKLYGFASDYPGIRHAGNTQSALREIDMRDMISLCVVLTGFSPYLTNTLDNERIFSG